ncbi:MAG TPA: tetratricopeptide repeat protein, partial [Candidatus Saccharimonadia bacterium]|nr:tetratricopeptide repeat protein [Candidatus Saccharimonadia bacterium]
DWPLAREALEALVRALPPRAALQYDLGIARDELGDAAGAEAAFAQALALEPALVEARFKLGVVALRAGRHAAAREHFEACLASRPEWPEAWLNFAECCLRDARLDEAVDAARRGNATRRDDPAALRLYARVLHAARRDYPAYLDVKRRLCEVEPTPRNHVELALALWEGFQHRAARVLLDETIARWPDYWPARWGRFQNPEQPYVRDEADAAAFLERWRDGVVDIERRIDADPGRVDEMRDCVRLNTNFYTHYLGLPLVDEQRRYGALLERMVGAATQGMPAPKTIAPPGTKRRIGFVSGYLRNHTIMKLFGPMIAALDRSRFEVAAFMLEEQVDAQTQWLRENVDALVSDEPDSGRWIATLASAGLDVLVFLDIGMHPVAQVLSALRFAPVQCVMWGHPVTTGRSTIDYFVSSEAMEPPGAEAHYTESLVRLPNLGTHYVPPDVAPVAPPSYTANPHADGVDYFFAQTVYKNTPIHDELFARIAQQLPGARFHLLPHGVQHVRDELFARMRPAFERRGLHAPDHVVMHPSMPLASFLGLAATCDVNLDSIGWSGGNTTLEILMHDVPTITLPGELMRARHTSAMLRQLGLDQLVARDLDDYVRIAVGVGRDHALRQRLSATIRERKARLYRDDAVVAAMNDFLANVMPRAAT